MLELLFEARRAGAACAAAPAWAVPDRDLADCLSQAWAGMQQLTAAMAHLVHQAQVQGVPKAHGASSTIVWLRQLLRLKPGTATQLIKLGEALDARPALDCAVSEGTISAEHAVAIAAIARDLPPEVGGEVIDKAESMLVDWARDFEPITLSKLGARILDHVAPEVAERREKTLLDQQEKRAHRNRAFTISPLGEGLFRLSGHLDATSAAIVNAALDPLCHPRHDPAGPRTPAQRRADALVDICAGALRSGTDLPEHGGDAAQVVVTVPLNTLTNQLTPSSNYRPADKRRANPRPPTGAAPADGEKAAAGTGGAGGAAGVGVDSTQGGPAKPDLGAGVGWLDTGAPISAAAARRLACDARIVPAVLGGGSQVLDLGRTRRLFTGPVRRALILRDRGCSFPSCDRPARWSAGHHIQAWADGGSTDLTNACLVCGFHHRLLHDDSGWEVRMAADGHPEYLPPCTIDPKRLPQRNTYHRRQ